MQTIFHSQRSTWQIKTFAGKDAPDRVYEQFPRSCRDYRKDILGNMRKAPFVQ
jgi:hypothetical protein